MNFSISRSTLLIAMTWLLVGCFQTALAKSCDETVARALSIQGHVERLTDEKAWVPIELNDPLCPGDRVRVGSGSRASLLLDNETLLRLAANSSVTIGTWKKEGATWLDLLEGMAHFISRARHGFQVNTPYVNAGIEGTEFTVESAPGYAAVTVLEGRVRARNAWGEVLLKGGQKAVAHPGEAPHFEQVVDPLDAVRWTLYYPPLSDTAVAYASMAGRRSFESYRRGDIEAAFSALAQVSGIERNASLLVYRAALHLRGGREEAARQDLASALRLEPEQADALSLLSIISTVQKQRQEALELAQRAVAAAPMGLSPLLALSYARQARFQLPEALKAAKQATKVAPESALAWSQRARLHFMFHEVDEASAAARRAVSIAPDRSYSLVTLGFVLILQMEFEDARQTFERAIKLDGAAAPLPRLGLGLLEIRQGHLAEGRRQLEVAANLDPNNAMIRSYLGKAYYDEKREKLAVTQFALAKQFDGLDPTAWFYNAILQLSENRPIEALGELQTAIDLNDNRAVYRSRYLLDQDEAARIATLGRIYADIGFVGMARIEAYKSLQASASNYSAHRLLAETEKVSDKAKNSELLQSQLLQPLNRHSLKPGILSSTYSLINSAGPSISGFSEYAPLFTSSNGLNLQIDGSGGSNHTKGNDLILSGLRDRVAFSLEQSRFETEGWRENSDGHRDYRDAFLQVALTPSTSFQFEYLQEDIEQGDRALRFEPDVFSDRDRFGRYRQNRRFGFHHRLASNGHFIFSLIDQDLQNSSFNIDKRQGWVTLPSGEVSPARLDITRSMLDDKESDTYEFQLIHPFHDHTFILGAGRHDATVVLTSVEQHTLNLLLTDPPFVNPIGTNPAQSSTFHYDTKSENIYLYGQFALSTGVGLTLGASHREVEEIGSLFTAKQTNPKLGLTWEVWKDCVFRAAYIESLTSPALKTIEPTQIAGFNQLFDFGAGGEVEQFGLGADAKLRKTLSLGAEFTRTDARYPEYNLSIKGDNSVFYSGHDQETYTAYIYWMASKRLGITWDYRNQKDTYKQGGIPQITIQTSSSGIQYYWPVGIYFDAYASYLAQKLSFTDVDKRSNFWYLNAHLGYRFPNRHVRFEIGIDNLLDKDIKLYNRSLWYKPEREVNATFSINF